MNPSVSLPPGKQWEAQELEGKQTVLGCFPLHSRTLAFLGLLAWCFTPGAPYFYQY